MLAPGKVNLFLLVGNRRLNGFHELASLVAPITLADNVEVEFVNQTGIAISCKLSRELEQHTRAAFSDQQYQQLISTLNSEDNIAARAAKIFSSSVGLEQGINIEINKRIPACAGLGGGSSDGAAVLLELNRLTENPLSTGELSKLAFELGSDVPQALLSSPAFISGIGEKVDPVELVEGSRLFELLSGSSLVIIKPTFSVSTKEAYQFLGRANVDGESTKKLNTSSLKLLKHWNGQGGLGDEQCGEHYHNDFLSGVESKSPEVKAIKKVAKEAGSEIVFMSGSGSAFVAILGSGVDPARFISEMRSQLSPETFLESAKFICKSYLRT